MSDAPRSRKGTGRFIGFAPFLGAGILGWILVVAAPHPAPLRATPLIAAGALTVVIVVLAILVSWRVLPDRVHVLPALVWLVVVYLMRDGAGGAASGFSALYLLSVLWPALYGTRRQLITALSGYALAQVVWIVLHRSPEQITFAVLGTMVAAVVGFTAQDLVRRVRAQNTRLTAINGVSRTLAMKEDLASTRDAVCVAAAELCNADDAVMYEPAGDGRLVVTACSRGDGSDVLAPWTSVPTPAADALRTGEQQFVSGGDATPGGSGASLWLPVIRGGRAVGVLGVAWSLPRRRVGGDIAVAMTLLAEQVATVIERTRLLNRQQEQLRELRELDRLKSDFVSSASHELRTPITSIRGYLDILVEGEAGPLSDEQRSFVQIADRNARRLQALVEDLLVVSRIESGRLQLSVREVDLVELAHRVGEGLTPQLSRSTVALRLDGPQQAMVSVDERRIEQVQVNLLSNAIKFSPDGGEVVVRIERCAQSVRMSVADQGIGMSDRDLQHLFEKFFRSESATERAIPGTGLGLAICKGIIDAHGGTIDVRSTPGKGTVVTVELPRRMVNEEGMAR